MTENGQRTAVLEALAGDLASVDLGRPVRVAIDGITAVGKTTFANQLADATRPHGRESVRVSMDGFHHLRSTRHRQGRESADGYYEDAYDFAALKRVLLDPLGPSGSRGYRTGVMDLATDRPVDAPELFADERLILIVDGSFLQRSELFGSWDRVIFLAASFEAARSRGVVRDAELLGSAAEADRIFGSRYHAAQRRYLLEAEPERRADIVVEHTDPQRPVVQSYRPLGASEADRRIDDAQSFFGPRAAGWNARFEEDAPAFARAVGELGVEPGATVVDVGCGAGRAFADLAAAVGPSGTVIGVDVTEEMVRAAHSGSMTTPVVVADAQRLPIATHACDAVFAAGLLSHLSEPVLGLVEMAQVARPGARLAVFHPVGRAALARKHGHALRPDDPLDPANIAAVLAASGWTLESLDDAADRYLALATRRPVP